MCLHLSRLSVRQILAQLLGEPSSLLRINFEQPSQTLIPGRAGGSTIPVLGSVAGMNQLGDKFGFLVGYRCHRVFVANSFARSHIDSTPSCPVSIGLGLFWRLSDENAWT